MRAERRSEESECAPRTRTHGPSAQREKTCFRPTKKDGLGWGVGPARIPEETRTWTPKRPKAKDGLEFQKIKQCTPISKNARRLTLLLYSCIDGQGGSLVTAQLYPVQHSFTSGINGIDNGSCPCCRIGEREREDQARFDTRK